MAEENAKLKRIIAKWALENEFKYELTKRTKPTCRKEESRKSIPRQGRFITIMRLGWCTKEFILLSESSRTARDETNCYTLKSDTCVSNQDIVDKIRKYIDENEHCFCGYQNFKLFLPDNSYTIKKKITYRLMK